MDTHTTMDQHPITMDPSPTTGWRANGRPVPHDILLQIARYLGDMRDAGDHEACLTLGSMMRIGSDAFDAAARILYASVTVSRSTFSMMFGGNDTPKSKLFEHPITFPTRASVVRKLALFQYTKHLHVVDLPSEQLVQDLDENWRVACSQPASGVACRQALGGTMFPRLESVSFGPDVFLNHHSVPPLGPENQGGLHRFLSLLRREASPRHMCLNYPTPCEMEVYMDVHPDSERPMPWAPTVPAPGLDVVMAGGPPLTAGQTANLTNGLDHCDDGATWPGTLARSWTLRTISAHAVRFGRLQARSLTDLSCGRLRIFAIDTPCSNGYGCKEGKCSHSDGRWSRAGVTIMAMARLMEEKPDKKIQVVELANVGAGFVLKCKCATEYANATAALKTYLRDRAGDAPWILELPHTSEATPCVCCRRSVKPTGDTGDGSPRGNTFNYECSDPHRWVKGFRPDTAAAVAVGGAAGGVAPNAAAAAVLGGGWGPVPLGQPNAAAPMTAMPAQHLQQAVMQAAQVAVAAMAAVGPAPTYPPAVVAAGPSTGGGLSPLVPMWAPDNDSSDDGDSEDLSETDA